MIRYCTISGSMSRLNEGVWSQDWLMMHTTRWLVWAAPASPGCFRFCTGIAPSRLRESSGPHRLSYVRFNGCNAAQVSSVLCCVRERAMSSASGTLLICGLVCDEVAVCGCRLVGLWAWMLLVVRLWAWMLPLFFFDSAWMLPVELCYCLHSSAHIQVYNSKEWLAKKLAEQSFWSINYRCKFSFISRPSNDKSMDES